MCRSLDYRLLLPQVHNANPDGLLLLDIKTFYLKLAYSLPSSTSPNSHHQSDSPPPPLPNSLTLVYLPRINGSPLEINGFSIRPDAPGFVTLHRVIVGDPMGTNMIGDDGIINYYYCVFGTRDWVRVGEGVAFQVYVGEERVLKGTFRRSSGGGDQCCSSSCWSMGCRWCILEMRENIGGADQVKEAQVCVAAEEGGKQRKLQVAIREKVKVKVKVKVAAKRHRRWRCRGFQGVLLEDIPEGREMDTDTDTDTEPSSVGNGRRHCCCCCTGSTVLEEGEEEDDHGKPWKWTDKEMKTEVEGEVVGWAVEFGIWVILCLGVGYFVSRSASSSSTSRLRHKRII
ncbi:hypothetical protein Dimus_034843 [Dionaea muscipula]